MGYWSAPKEGENPKVGFNFVFYDKNNECIHIHHWVIMIILISVTISLVCISKGWFNIPILFLLGFFLGALLEDFRYKDAFEFRKKCK